MKRREHLSPDLTPLIDVVFLILIFFLVSATFKKEELALMLTLPDTQSAAEEIRKEEISIELSTESVAYRGKKVDFESLDRLLEAVKEKSHPVNVRIDKQVPYERVVKLLDLLNKHSLNNLALETHRER
ncbi:MAG TPA: biopolymer transporter ExbD [Campylobacteraceae bacterium]|jgi:biopolymer transport protein ExbD|nr:biopolymer transporter ExbD [Campylobacteraceae bacterium]